MSSESQDAPRYISRKPTGSDRVFHLSSAAIGSTVLLITGGVGLFLAIQSFPALQHYGMSFFTTADWAPQQGKVGIAAVLVGTFVIATVALIIAFPLALTTALYITEYAPLKIKGFLVSMIDLMAAIPSIIYGLWGFMAIQPHAAGIARWLHVHLGWIPIFQVHDASTSAASPDEYATRYTASAFTAGIAVAMMVMPQMCSVMRQVFSQTPPGEREAALALGSTRWGVIRAVVLPFGRGGIIGGTMLGLGRALGETIAVLLIISPAFEVKVRPLEIGGNSIASLIAGRFGDATASQLQALLLAGLVLFIITLIINTLAAMVVSRSRSGADAEA